MRRFAILAAALATLAAAPAFAAEKAGDPGTNVPMPFLIAPMSKDGKLLGYAYISSKLVASSERAAHEISDKIVFIQDAADQGLTRVCRTTRTRLSRSLHT